MGFNFLSVQELRYEQRIRLPASDVELMRFAENRDGYSTPAVLRLGWDGAGRAADGNAPAASGKTAALTATTDLRPVQYVLAIGTSKYLNTDIQVDYAAKDEGDFAKLFKRQERPLYRKVEVGLLTDAKARRGIGNALSAVVNELSSAENGVIVFAASIGSRRTDAELSRVLPEGIK